jgi:hypothetical protein
MFKNILLTMKQIKFLKFNGAITDNLNILNCDIVNSILIDTSHTEESLIIENDLFSRGDIELFFQFSYRPFLQHFENLQNKITLIQIIRICNYLGCDKLIDKLVKIYTYLSTRKKLTNIESFICRKELSKSEHKFPQITLTLQDYQLLIEMGYDKEDIFLYTVFKN